jgi:hypothetical protein
LEPTQASYFILGMADGRDYPDNGARFALFGRAVLEAMRSDRRPADVLHGHDWQSGPAILLLRHRYAGYPLLGSVPIAFCNRVGNEEGLTFWGGSRLISADGSTVVQAPLWEEALVVGTLNTDDLRMQRYGLPLLADYLREDLGLEGARLAVVAPDAGRVKTAERLREHLDCELAFIYKRRSRHEAHKIETMTVVGEVEGKACILVDDIIDTAGTMAEGAKALARDGAAQIYAAATHPVLSGKAMQRLEEAPIKEVVVTNTLPVPQEKQMEKMTVLSIAPIIASALQAVFEDESVSEIFHGENQP